MEIKFLCIFRWGQQVRCKPEQVMVSFHSDSYLDFGLRFWGRSSQDTGARVRCTRERLEATTYPSVWSNWGNKTGVFPSCLIWWWWKQLKIFIFLWLLPRKKSSSRESTQQSWVPWCTPVLPAFQRGLWAPSQPELHSETHLKTKKQKKNVANYFKSKLQSGELEERLYWNQFNYYF